MLNLSRKLYFKQILSKKLVNPWKGNCSHNMLYPSFINIVRMLDRVEIKEKEEEKPVSSFSPQSYVRIIEGKSKSKKVKARKFFENPEKEIFSIKFNNDDTLFAVSLSEGIIDIFNVETQKKMHTLTSSPDGMPTTCLRWRPAAYGSRSRNILVSGNSEGSISYWHVASGKLLTRIFEKDNHVLTMDYSRDGTTLATAGKDSKIRIYNEAMKTVEYELEGASFHNPGHTNRIFCVKFIEEDSNVVISGGWDSNVHIWDLRERKSVGSFHGPHISGESLDYKDGGILCGSYRNKDQLQVYDMKMRTLLYNIEWEKNVEVEDVYVFSTQHIPLSDAIMAAASGRNQVKLFDTKSSFDTIATIAGFMSGCYAADIGKSGTKLVVGTGDGVVGLFSIL